jgi:hypothetical protein
MSNKLNTPSRISLALLFGAASAPGIALADLVCHVPDDNAIIMMEVKARAVEAHLRHGDYLPYMLYRDADNDGFGDPETLIPNCLIEPGCYADNGDDDDDGYNGEIKGVEEEEEGESEPDTVCVSAG